MTAIDAHQISEWRSIVTLVVFILTNIVVLFPFHIPVHVPRRLWVISVHALQSVRILDPRERKKPSLRLPLNFVTTPLIADLFLLAILAIGRQEVHDGTVGANGIAPIDIMVFFFSLAYIALSIDASGLIRYLAFRVLQKGGKNGYRLYLYLFVLFFALAVLVGNDPVISSGTAFLAYMTRAARNISNPRAWIFAQFAVANVGSAIFVSSNPTNLVLAGAFDIKFVEYTANMIVPAIVTVIVLCPSMYAIFHDRPRSLIPPVIEMDELSEQNRVKTPINPNIPFARESMAQHDTQQIPLEEILNPFLDKRGAAFGTVLICISLVVIFVLNAVTSVNHEHPVFWVTLPAAVVMFCWDVTFGWLNRGATRSAADEYRRLVSSRGSQVENENEVEGGTRQDLPENDKASLESVLRTVWTWSRATFPTASAVLSLLPYALVPFSLAMFVLVQALVTRGWVDVLAVGWHQWINVTGTVGAVGGMGFVSVLLCNFAGTNIGTTILLCRVIQSWVQIHADSGHAISQRTFWASVYGMALGVNYDAFSIDFSASLAGLLWRNILSGKHIRISALEFARYNMPIIAVAMAVGCAVLVGEVYITRSDMSY